MVNSYEAVVNSFYLAYYGRPADPSGLAFWSMQLERAGGDFGLLVDAFAASEEATVRFQGDTTAERIATIYQQVFDRAPDADGLAFWVGAVENGATTLAAVAVDMLQGAQGSDITISMLRQQAAADFTSLASTSGIAFDGYAAIEASRALVSAVRADTSAADVAAMVKAAGSLVQTIHDNPAVLAALGSDGQLASLFATARGKAEGVDLLQALADVAKAAAGNPATLESLLRGGGMAKVLEAMPAAATLHDVVDALATGGLAAAVEVVYPTDPAPQPEPYLDIKFDTATSTLTLTGDARYAATVDLDAHTVTYNGQSVAVGAGAEIAKVVSTGYPGQVTLSGKVAALEAVLAQSAGVDGYRVVDIKAALFDGPADARTLASGAADLLKGAATVVLADTLSAAEAALLRNLDGFDTTRLVATVDDDAPAAGTLHFVAGAETLGATPFVKDGSFTLAADGFEAGAQVHYQVADGHGGWTDLASATLSGLQEGTYSFRAVVADAAGNVSYTEAAAIVVDQTLPTVASVAFGTNDGKLALGESVDLTVSFDDIVVVDGIPALRFANGGQASYVSGSGSATLVFKYTPAAGQSTTAIALDAQQPFSGTILDRAGNALDDSGFDGVAIGAAPAVDVEAPLQTLVVTTISQDGGTSASVEGSDAALATNLASATVSARLSAGLSAGEHVEVSLDGGHTWSTQQVSVTGTAVTIAGVATGENPTLMVRVADDAGNGGTAASRAIVHDTVAPVAGTLGFSGLTLSSHADPLESLSNDSNFSLVLDGMEAGARFTYEMRVGQGAWSGMETPAVSNLEEGSYSFRATVTDAAGNSSHSETIGVTIDRTGPAVTAMAFAINDGKLALGEPVELTVSFGETVYAGTDAALAFSNGGSAVYVSGSGSDQLVFKYTPGAGQSSAGLALSDLGPLSGTVTDRAGNAPAADAFEGIVIDHAPAVDADAPAQVLAFTTIAQLSGTSASVAGTDDPLSTNIGLADVRATLSAALGSGEHVEVSFDGGATWRTQDVTTFGTTVTVAGVATVANPTLSLRVVDEAGNAGAVASRAVVYDATPPAAGTISFAGLTLSSHAGALESLSNDGDFSLQLEGVEADARIVYEMREGTGSWSVMDAPTVSDLAEGSYSFHAIVTDAAGNASTTDAIGVTIDKTGPAVTGIAVGTNDGKLALGESVTLTVSFGENVYTDGSATIALDNGGTATYVSGSGSDQLVFTYTPAAGESTGQLGVSWIYPVDGVLTDRAGNQPAHDAFEGLAIDGAPLVDVVAPTTTVTSTSIGQQAGEGSAVTGASNTLATNQPIADVHATLSAALGTDEHVEVSFDGGASWSTQGVSASGTMVTVAGVPAMSNPTVALRIVDAAGNGGTAVSRTVVLDTEAPDGGTLAFVSVGQSILDQDKTDNVTSIALPKFTFQHDGPWLASGEHFEFSVDGTHWQTGTQREPATGLLSFYADISQGTLDSDGNRASTVSVRAVDNAGNARVLVSHDVVYDGGVATPVVKLDIDTANPYGPGNDGVTSEGGYTVSGIEDGAIVEYSLTGSGDWTSTKPVLAEGTHEVYVRQTDVAGNTATGSLRYTLDTAVPSAPTLALAIDSGANNTDKITKAGTVNVSGLETAAGTTWEYRLDDGDWIQGGVIDSQGKSSLAVTVDGEHTVLVRQYDAAGNASDLGTLSFTLDATAATLAFDHVEGYTGTVKNATLLGQADVVFGYTGDIDTGDKIEFRFGIGNWVTSDKFVVDTVNHTITLPDFDLSGADGQFVMRVTDAVGNVSNEASTFIDGPYGNPALTMAVSADGLTLTSSADGTLYTRSAAGGTVTNPVLSGGQPVQVSAGVPILLGEQSTSLTGVIFGVKTASGTVYLNEGTNSYWLGKSGMDSTSLSSGKDYVIWGFGGNDTFFGNSGNDTIYGGAGNDTLNGQAGDDYLNGGIGTNTLTGGAGADRIDIVLGQNTLNYAAGDSPVSGFDVVTFAASAGANTARQTFHFAETLNDVERLANVAAPADGSTAALMSALSGAYQDFFAASANMALVVDFDNGDHYLVKDTGNGTLGNEDYVIKLVGDIPMSLNSIGNDVIFGNIGPM